MAFVDEIVLKAQAGKGGDGVVRWLHTKGKEFGGPSGGNGGRGGDVFVRAVRDLSILAKYRTSPKFKAENGQAGDRNEMTGRDGEPVYIDVPIGSRIVKKETGEEWELLEEGQTEKIFSGGRGGYGNAHFKSSTNQYPDRGVPGAPGEGGNLFIEVRIIADVGFVGLPNAGKSSLLNSLTSARAKIGAYPFTTLEPNLGAYHGYILADIPGLIEGASEGKGLGHTFLRHVSRTKTLIHCISVENEDLIDVYETVSEEIKKYDTELSRKPEIVFLTKVDLVEEKEVKEKIKVLESLGKPVVPVSILDDELLKTAGDTIARFLEKQ